MEEVVEMSEESQIILVKRKKFAWIAVAAMVVGAIVGSGIVRHSVNWPGTGGTYAIFGVLLVWIVFFIIGIAMCDNVSMMPEKGGVYAWSRKTMGRFWGIQIGWIYLVGFICLSVILSWFAYENTLLALVYFFPQKEALLAATIFSIIIPMLFIAIFTFVITLGVKKTTQIIVGFFTVKVTMWLTIVGIGLLHFEPSVAKNTPNMDPLVAILSVGLLSLFAMNGIDAVSVTSDDIHKPGKNYLKGVIVGMLIVLLLYLSAVIVIMGLVGQEGAKYYMDNGGITAIFLNELSVPSPVLLVFMVISIIGTLFINMYMLVRLCGAMAENGDFFFSKHAQKHLKEEKKEKGIDQVEMPLIAIIISTLIYGIFFVLIFIENTIDPENTFVLYVIDQFTLYPFLVVLFFIALTNFKAHHKGLAKKRRVEKQEYKWMRGQIIPVLGMLAVAFIIGLSIYMMIVKPSNQLPGPGESYAWQFWTILGLIFPTFMVVPGLLYWTLIGKKKSLPVEYVTKDLIKQELKEKKTKEKQAKKEEKRQQKAKSKKEKKVKEPKPKKEKKAKKGENQEDTRED